MLTSEQAQERLKTFENPHYQSERLAQIMLLFGNLSHLGQMLIGAGPDWEIAIKTNTYTYGVQRELMLELGKLSAGDRQKLFKALFPKIASQVEATWNLFDRLPYQTGYTRRPFRSPNHALNEARSSWVLSLLRAVRRYDQDAAWLATWAPYLNSYGAADTIGRLLAGTIDQGGPLGQEVYDILIASAEGTHATGVMGRHVVRGLLCAPRPEGWAFIERLLLAAQREEGLRQVILEGVDEAYPDAFRRMLRLILENNLTRFSAAVRAFDVWFGLAFESIPPKAVNDILGRVLNYLDDPAERDRVIREGAAEETYFALWALAFEDVQVAFPRAAAQRASDSVEHRFAAVHLLAQMELTGGLQELLAAMDDSDLRIVARAVDGSILSQVNATFPDANDLFERLEKVIARLPHKQNNFKPLVWDWLALNIDREVLTSQLLNCLGKRSPTRLLPYLKSMPPQGRAQAAALLKEVGKKDAGTRQVLFELAGDRSSQVREKALESIRGFFLSEAEYRQLEDLLTREADDLRRGILQIFLLELKLPVLLQTIRRLLEQKNENQRRAGLEMLRECLQAGRAPEDCRNIARAFQQKEKLSDAEERILADLLVGNVERYTLEDALGLMNPQERSQPTPPRVQSLFSNPLSKVKLGSPAAAACLQALDQLIDAHRTDPVNIQQYNGVEKGELLGNIQWGFPQPDSTLTPEQNLERLPLAEVWQDWWQNRPKNLRDPDDMELLRALAAAGLFERQWTGSDWSAGSLDSEWKNFLDHHYNFTLHYHSLIGYVLRWLVYVYPVANQTEFLLDAVEKSLGRIPETELTETWNFHFSDGRQRNLKHGRLAFLMMARDQRDLHPETWNAAQHARLWGLIRWLDKPKANSPRLFPNVEDAAYAYQAGAAIQADLFDLLIGDRGEQGRYGIHFPELHDLSGRRPHSSFQKYPFLKEAVDVCRERILRVETHRGDLPTAASVPAMDLRSVPGQEHLFELLAALGKEEFERGYLFGQSRSAVLSHLVRVSYPLESDTPEDFASLARQGKVAERRLVELAVYAPQWSTFVEFALGWPKLSEAVWWVYAHTKDRQWTIDNEIRAEWAAQVSEFTPLSADSLMDGAVDVAWFHQVYAALGEKRWQEVYRAAEYAAGGGGHARARLFADAMLGKVDAETLCTRITTKRYQDAVRALGLVPLPEGASRQAEILGRYEVMQEFLRSSKKFGSQRQASEKLAVAIGLENLARAAGYAEPQRLEWAMEVEAVADLAAGPVEVDIEGTRLSLSIDDLGTPQLSVAKNGKPLKAIPPYVKKDPRGAALIERKHQLERQIGRMRLSLEQAMCRGDTFNGQEIQNLFRHPMLRTMLEQLVLVGPGGMGYPVDGGRALFNHRGQQIRVADEDRLAIAHPLDLLRSEEWHLWQHECFVAERIQPFKQVFRELYLLTATEKAEGNLSRRYAGHQVNPRQALALFGARGWVAAPEEGVHKTFHDLGISARVGFLQTIFTPAEVEGLTLEAVAFTRRGDWKPIPLEQVPPRIFSETMRDLDLVVSVAHAGGVDPEASASSIEARTALVQETCGLLNLPNVEVKNNHALVTGKLGNYSIHLGSAVVHRQPGGALCIVPVHAQQRGRLFLPFVDNDPKTAEVISKVLLLAKDNEIKDPSILEQILR